MDSPTEEGEDGRDGSCKVQSSRFKVSNVQSLQTIDRLPRFARNDEIKKALSLGKGRWILRPKEEKTEGMEVARFNVKSLNVRSLNVESLKVEKI